MTAETKELNEIVAALTTRTTAKELNKIAGNRFTRFECRSALEKQGKLERVGQGASLSFKPVHDYVKSLTGKTPAREIVKKFGITRTAATDILQAHGKFLPMQNHDRRKKIPGQPLPPTAAQLARELPAPMTPREFSERYKISKKTAYDVLRSANKILIKQVKLKPEPKPKQAATPKPKQAAKKAKVKGEKSLDNFMKGILKAAKVKADRYNYID